MLLIETIRRYYGAMLSCTVLVMSLGVNLYLVWPTPGFVPVETGETLPGFWVMDVANPGAPPHFKALNGGGQRGTVVYVMSPTCVFCERNFPNIKTLAGTAGDYEFVGVSTTDEGLASFLGHTPYPFPVYALDMERVPGNFDPSATPQTILLDADGVVRQVWVGALPEGSKQLESLEETFGIGLPGASSAGYSY